MDPLFSAVISVALCYVALVGAQHDSSHAENVAPAHQPTPQPSSSSSVKLPVPDIVVGAVSCAIAACILLLTAASFFVRRWHSQKSTTALEQESLPLRRFTLKELQGVTGNFGHKLGSYATSNVFKGWIEDKPVAVKKVDAKGGGEKEFLAAVDQASRVKHENLVRLLGFCVEETEKMLVYEYLRVGSLDTILPNATNALDWTVRYGIAKDVAETLAFLHEECGDQCLVHGNIKLENIMLNEDLSAKVADFGLADFVVREKALALKNAKGTEGVLSPAWLSNFKASAAGDVYGYGVVLLSLILGRDNVDGAAGSRDRECLERVYRQAQEGKYMEAVDGRLGGKADEDQVKVAVQAALWCMQDEASSRPSMAKVVELLKDCKELGLPSYRALAFASQASDQVVVDVDREIVPAIR